jgi:hypothetical protein
LLLVARRPSSLGVTEAVILQVLREENVDVDVDPRFGPFAGVFHGFLDGVTEQLLSDAVVRTFRATLDL